MKTTIDQQAVLYSVMRPPTRSHSCQNYGANNQGCIDQQTESSMSTYSSRVEQLRTELQSVQQMKLSLDRNKLQLKLLKLQQQVKVAKEIDEQMTKLTNDSNL